MTKRVLFIDDEAAATKYYRTALEWAGYTVDYRSTAAQAVEAIQRVDEVYAVIVLDLSLPPEGTLTASRTAAGLASGVVLLTDYIRKSRPKIPVLVLTNVPRGPILDALPKEDSRRLRVVHKIDTSAFELPVLVDQMLDDPAAEPGKGALHAED